MTTIKPLSLRLNKHLEEKLERYRARIEAATRKLLYFSDTATVNRTRALNGLIEAAVEEDGTPRFSLDLPGDEVVRHWRRKIHQDARESALSFRPSQGAQERLDRLAYYLSALSPVEVNVDRAAALRTLIAEALDADGCIMWHPSYLDVENWRDVHPELELDWSPHTAARGDHSNHLDIASNPGIDVEYMLLEGKRTYAHRARLREHLEALGALS